MPSGDTLAIIGLAITAMIGALTVSGWRAKFLWGLTAVFVVVALGYAGLFSAVGISLPGLSQWIVPLIAPVVVGTVALMLREKSAASVVAEELGQYPRKDALAQISSAIDNADWGDLAMPAEAIGPARATLQSAFVTARKVFGVETPMVEPTAVSVAEGVAFLRSILPYLRAGHDEQAREAAMEFIALS